MGDAVPAYGLWGLAIANIAIFLIFAFSFAPPASPRDWRAFGAFSAFIVALFAEMYGFPLTIYFLSGWLLSRYPGLDLYSHNAGHLWETIFGWSGSPHVSLLHILSNILIVAGFILLSASWKVLFRAQKEHAIATTGPYARIRHPQYLGFIIIMFGFLLQWPTIITLIMFPILTVMYARLALWEEAQMVKEFGEAYERYRERTPAFLPRFASPQSPRS
ncbi:MAG: isoprenylcysteine carboxylmethyltransferase family protein [Candidatus Peribacteraceae bacterium]